MTDFELQNDEPAKPPATFESDDTRQKVLFSGLDCLPGQLDLFPTDGPPEEKN